MGPCLPGDRVAQMGGMQPLMQLCQGGQLMSILLPVLHEGTCGQAVCASPSTCLPEQQCIQPLRSKIFCVACCAVALHSKQAGSWSSTWHKSCRLCGRYLERLCLSLQACFKHIFREGVPIIGGPEVQAEVVWLAPQAVASHAEAVAENGPGAWHVECRCDHRALPAYRHVSCGRRWSCLKPS